MQIEKYVILGKSDVILTMIMDNLASHDLYPLLQIINNLNLPVTKTFDNPKFNYQLLTEVPPLDETTGLLLGVMQTPTKQAVFNFFKMDRKVFSKLIHQTAAISATTYVGFGSMVNSLVSVAAHSHIGDFVSINRNASVGHHTHISDFTTINPGANIAGNVHIGANVQIGMGANVVDGVFIGENSIIGAGALITKDIPANVLAYGVPAKIVGNI